MTVPAAWRPDPIAVGWRWRPLPGRDDSGQPNCSPRLTAAHDVREAWLGLATARRRLGDPAGAARRLAQALRRHVVDPGHRRASADAIARECRRGRLVRHRPRRPLDRHRPGWPVRRSPHRRRRFDHRCHSPPPSAVSAVATVGWRAGPGIPAIRTPIRCSLFVRRPAAAVWSSPQPTRRQRSTAAACLRGRAASSSRPRCLQRHARPASRALGATAGTCSAAHSTPAPKRPPRPRRPDARPAYPAGTEPEAPDASAAVWPCPSR